MENASSGWAVLQIGEHPPHVRWSVARTTDGGREWVEASPWGSGPGPVDGAVAADFPTATDAWVAIAGSTRAAGTQGVTVYHTTDSGHLWTHRTVGTGLPYGDPVLPVAFSFPDATHGWLMVQPEHGMGSEPGALVSTTDGGQTWTRIAGTYGPGGKRGNLPFGGRIGFVDATTGWLAGGLVSTIDDLLYVTHDSGRTWRPVHLPVPAGRTRQQMVVAPPTFSGAKGVLPVWFQGRAATYLYGSSDGGATWRYTEPVQSAMPEVLAIHDVVAVEGETLYRTTDGGRRWTATRAGGDLPVLLARRGASIQGADFTDAQHGWLFGTEPAHAITEKSQWANTPISPFLVETRDGGRTWTRIAPVLRAGHGATTK